MALIFLGKSTCSICGAVLASGQAIIGCPHVVPIGDPLRRFSDSGMHESCFEQWEHRERMLELYGGAIGEIRDEPEPVKTRLGVLGSADERAALLQQLQQLRHGNC